MTANFQPFKVRRYPIRGGSSESSPPVLPERLRRSLPTAPLASRGRLMGAFSVSTEGYLKLPRRVEESDLETVGFRLGSSLHEGGITETATESAADPHSAVVPFRSRPRGHSGGRLSTPLAVAAIDAALGRRAECPVRPTYPNGVTALAEGPKKMVVGREHRVREPASRVLPRPNRIPARDFAASRHRNA